MVPHPVLTKGWWRRGLTARERRTGPEPPRWAIDAEQALARAEEPRAATRTCQTWQQGYAEVVRPFVAWAADQVPQHARTASFTERLRMDLVDLAARTLTFELNQCRVAGTLIGSDGRERFVDFVRRARGPAEIAVLLTHYPVLARLLLVACRSAATAYTETVRRFAADRAAITHRFFDGIDPGDPVALDLRRGDSHRGGRSVSILVFAGGGRLVYKPRSLTACLAFAQLTRWLEERVPGLGLRTARMLERGDYGWQEYVPAAPCHDKAGVRRFHRRTGALLALLHAVRASDVHYGNVVACGDHPVLIDLETLFHPDLLREGVGTDPAARVLASSVHRTGVLPTYLFGDRVALDISALGGDPGGPHPIDGVEWEAPATDRMRLVRRPRPFDSGVNRPTENGRVVEPADYVDDLLAGFRAGYDVIAADRESFLDEVGRMELAETRVVLRPTNVYQALLTESTHPDLLRDAADRDKFFALLWMSSADLPRQSRLVPCEIADLWQGDVPIFLGHPDSTDLRVADGTRLRDTLGTAGRTSAVETIGALGADDRRTQEWVVRATLATRRPARNRRTDTPRSADPLAAAQAIGDQICDLAVVDRSRANWLGLAPSGDRLLVMPMGASLAYGYTGVALFLAQLAALTGVARFARFARLAVRGVPQMLSVATGRSDLIRAVGCGASDGFGGIAYALARIATLTGDDGLRRWTYLTVDLAAEAAGEDAPSGVADGLAGCRAAMVAVDAELNHAPAAALAARCARLLAPTATENLDLGFGSGTDAGVPTPGLNGLAGDGYRHLLRLATPQHVPSVFHLESSTTAAHHGRLTFPISVPRAPMEEQ